MTMLPFLVFDLPTIGAFALAAILVAVVYLIYRDIRMIMQMVVDLREEFMLLRLGTGDAGSDEDEEEEEDECDAGDGIEDLDGADDEYRALEGCPLPLRTQASHSAPAFQTIVEEDDGTDDDASGDAEGYSEVRDPVGSVEE